MSQTGKVKGTTLKTDAEFVKKKWGADGLFKVESTLNDFGFPLNYQQVKAMDWYPIGQRILSLLALQTTFNLNETDIKALGQVAPKFSFIIRLVAKFFMSAQMTFAQSPRLWLLHYSEGTLQTSLQEEDHFGTATITGVKLHPVLCKYLEGYFQTLVELTIGKKCDCRETKCPAKGDEHHEYQITW